MFVQGLLRGLRVGGRRFPLSCQVLTAFARASAPKHVFTSLNLFLRVGAALHADANNDRYPNLVAGISNFSRGQILVENPRTTCHADPPLQVVSVLIYLEWSSTGAITKAFW